VALLEGGVNMANMSYCRFENTYDDLRDCFNNWGGDLSESEEDYRERMIKLCEDIANYYRGNE